MDAKPVNSEAVMHLRVFGLRPNRDGTAPVWCGARPSEEQATVDEAVADCPGCRERLAADPACTCGDALAANQWWHLPGCPREPLDRPANGLAAEPEYPVCPACGERLAPGHLRWLPQHPGETFLTFEVCPGGRPSPAVIIAGV